MKAKKPMKAVAYRIATPRTILRCWDPGDAPRLQEAITRSHAHLLPWIPWAPEEPRPVDAQIDKLRAFRAQFDRDEQYIYGIFDRDDDKVLGGTGLHTRVGPGALEIGYWTHVDHINKGLATEVSAALTRVAFEAGGVDRMEIHCDPRNQASAAVPRKLGYTLEATLKRRAAIGEGPPQDSMIWTLFASDYPASPAAELPVEAYDAAGRPLALSTSS